MAFLPIDKIMLGYIALVLKAKIDGNRAKVVRNWLESKSV